MTRQNLKNQLTIGTGKATDSVEVLSSAPANAIWKALFSVVWKRIAGIKNARVAGLVELVIGSAIVRNEGWPVKGS